MKKAYLITNIEQYGKLIAYCIKHDICVFRTYWDELTSGSICYMIDWNEKRCYYSDKEYWLSKGFEIIEPDFGLDQYGNYFIRSSAI